MSVWTLLKQRAFVVIALTGLISLSCQGEQVETVGPDAKFNVVLISIDTLRPDHLGLHGHEVPTSPSLDAFSKESVVFDQAIAHAPSTLHSHASILSSLLPHHHQATWNGKTRLPDEALTLAEVLQQKGYATAAFTGGGQMDKVFGLDQGFDSYVQPGESRFFGTVEKGLEWLDQRPEGPFMLFLHTYEIHHPYEPDPHYLELVETREYDGDLPDEISIDLLREINRKKVEIDVDDLEHIKRTYDAEIRSMDDGFGYLIAGLKEREIYDDTLIVFTSDHGEEFGEHGVVGWHSHTLYDELLRVPLMIKFPGSRNAGSRVGAQVRSIDIPTTVLGALQLAIPEQFSGVDLAGSVEGETLDLVAIGRMDRAPSKDISSVRTEEWKLNRKSLHRLTSDPGEEWDTGLNRRDVVDELEALLRQALAERDRLEPVQVVPTDSTLDELKALGYLQ